MRHRNDVDWERERKLNTIKNLAVNEICLLASVRVRVGLSRETDKVLRTTERDRERERAVSYTHLTLPTMAVV